MITPETPETKKLAWLAKTLAATCEKAVAETRTGRHTVPIIMVALAALTPLVKPTGDWY